MENKLVWQDRFNIGVEIIDKEHKKLFSIMNRLLMFSEQEDKIQWVCQEGIKYFKDHALKHFAEEEVYMASIGYAGFEMHRRVHDNFRKNTLPALEKELVETNFSKDAVSHFLSVCAGWLIGHTLLEDRAITGKVTSKWVNLLPEEEQGNIKRLINQSLYDLFQLNTKLISAHYGGEKFINGIYYRISYVNEKKETWEVFLIFEEKLLLETIGKMLGSRSNRLNVELMNAVRYTAKQLVNRICDYLPQSEMFEIQEENLLSYEQFEQVFLRPRVSLLFDTGEGYFAFGVMSPDITKKETGTAINSENAVSEITKYLQKNILQSASDKKRKILVVDDSDTVRLAMQTLLKEDYYVTVANSGLDAIRCITLNHPDLVLLDYEMPVCDGVQVLQMIRSEEDFANIPVFFLTSRVDKASVTKVIPLRPEGYLLKSLHPTDIKKNIDGYFRKRKIG